MDKATAAPKKPRDGRGSESPQESFESFLARLDTDREAAGQKYEDLRRKLIHFFQWNSCLNADDLADETLDRVQEKLEKADILNLPAYVFGVARKIRQEALKAAGRHFPLSEPSISAGRQLRHLDLEHPADKLERERQIELFQECLACLPEGDRALLLKYQSLQTADRKALAETYGLTIGTLRVRVNRIRARVEAILREQSSSAKYSTLERSKSTP